MPVILAALLGISSCKKDYAISRDDYETEYTLYEENTNVELVRTTDLEAFAFALNKAIKERPNLTSAIKENVKQKFDGDFDVLFSAFSSVPVQNGITRSGGEETVIDLLSKHIISSNKTKSGDNYLSFIQEQYPLLQISVPVHADALSEKKVPVIAYIPDGVNESEIDFIPGFNSDGELVLVDAKNEPSFPVIVIGQNERVQSSVSSSSSVPTPTGLSAIATEDRIILTWDRVQGVYGYRIYKRNPGGSSYALISTVIGSNNTIYEDMSLIPDSYYSYYISSVAIVDNSLALSTPTSMVMVKSPSLPAPISNFQASYCGTSVELTWSNGGYSNHTINLKYEDPYTSSNFVHLTTLQGNQNMYSFTPPFRGRKMHFSINRSNNIGHSEMEYDFIYPPYRNSAAASPIYNREISVNSLEGLESWISGAPEFMLSVFGINPDGSRKDIVSDIMFEFDKRTERQEFENRIIYNWIYDAYSGGGWYETLNFYLIEKDSNLDMTITVPLKKAKKVNEVLNLEAGATFSFKLNSNGNICGSAPLYYFDNPEKQITFQNYGATMTISEFRGNE